MALAEIENVRFVYTNRQQSAHVYHTLVELAREHGICITTDAPDNYDILQAWQQGREERGEA